MPWVIYSVGSDRREALDAALKDDLVSRQSQKVRDGPSVGGASGTAIVLVEGSAAALDRLGQLLGPAGSRLQGEDAERLYRRLKDEEEAASAGMGLFFTEG
jgi:hypothetical protein